MQLGKLLEEVYVSCGLQVLRRKATGGTTTTIVDTGMINRRPDGYFAQGANGGHILFMSQTTDFNTPQGQFGEISAYTLSTSTPTFTVPTMLATAASGDIYAVMKPTISLYEMIDRINVGLGRLPALELVDETLTTLEDTLAYDLPFAVGAYELLGVEIGTNDPGYGWQDAPGFSIVPRDGSTTDKLVFTSQPPYDALTPANKTIRIRYRGKHQTLYSFGEYVEKSVPDELAIAVCAEAAWELLMRKRPAYYKDQTRMTMYQDIQKRAKDALADNPIRMKPASRMPRINLGEL